MGGDRSDRDDDRVYHWQGWLLALSIAICAAVLIGLCSWRLRLAVAP